MFIVPVRGYAEDNCVGYESWAGLLSSPSVIQGDDIAKTAVPTITS